MIIPLRPHVVFSLIDDSSFEGTKGIFRIPNKYNFTGSPLVLEKFVIYTLMRHSQPKKIFEFGTYMGSTTRLFDDNTPADTEIFTIDIGTVTDALLERSPSQEDLKLIQMVEKTAAQTLSSSI